MSDDAARNFSLEPILQVGIKLRTRRVTAGRNGDVGRGAFLRFLSATSTHRYALTTNPFPASATGFAFPSNQLLIGDEQRRHQSRVAGNLRLSSKTNA
jgi:hypothetical protein